MKSMKRILSIMLGVILISTSVAPVSFAEGEAVATDATYTIEEDFTLKASDLTWQIYYKENATAAWFNEPKEEPTSDDYELADTTLTLKGRRKAVFDIAEYEKTNNATVTGFSYEMTEANANSFGGDSLPYFWKGAAAYDGSATDVYYGQKDAYSVGKGTSLSASLFTPDYEDLQEWNDNTVKCADENEGSGYTRTAKKTRYITVAYNDDGSVSLTKDVHLWNDEADTMVEESQQVSKVTLDNTDLTDEKGAYKKLVSNASYTDHASYGDAITGVETLDKVLMLSTLGGSSATYENLKLHAEKTTEYNDQIVSFANANPIVIDMKENTYEASKKYTTADARLALEAYDKLDETVQTKIEDAGYYSDAIETALEVAALPVPQVTGATMKVESNLDKQNLMFRYQFQDNTEYIPEGYTLKEYGALFVTAGGLQNATDKIDKDYSVKEDDATNVTPLRTSIVSDNDETADVNEATVAYESLADASYKFDIKVAGTAFSNISDEEFGSYAGVKIVTRAYALYVNTDNEEVWVYSTKDAYGTDGTTLVAENGQCNRSLVGCAKNIFSYLDQQDENTDHLTNGKISVMNDNENTEVFMFDVMNATKTSLIQKQALVTYLSNYAEQINGYLENEQ